MGKVNETFLVGDESRSNRVEIEVKNGFGGNKIKIHVDGTEVVSKRISFNTRGGERFMAGGQQLEVRWIWGEVSGQPKSVVVIDEQEQILWMHKSDQAAKLDIDMKMPGWAWVFVILSAAIPVISLGGLVPIVIGLTAGYSVRNVSMNPSRTTMTNVLMCLGVVVTAWVAFVAFAVIVFQMIG